MCVHHLEVQLEAEGVRGEQHGATRRTGRHVVQLQLAGDPEETVKLIKQFHWKYKGCNRLTSISALKIHVHVKIIQ